jgi:hypothetical protein
MSNESIETKPSLPNRKTRRAREQRAEKIFSKALSQGAIVEHGLKTCINGAPFRFRFRVAVAILLGVWQ